MCIIKDSWYDQPYDRFDCECGDCPRCLRGYLKEEPEEKEDR